MSTIPVKTIDLVLPNLFAILPVPNGINLHLKESGPESAAWVDSFNFFEGPVREQFIRSDLELFVALVYPQANRGDYRTTCDYMNSFFVFDNITDEQNGSSAIATADTYLKALAGEECEQSDTAFYQFVSGYSARIRAKNLPRLLRRFMQNHGSYAHAVAREADLRTRGVVLSFDEYIVLRRNSVGARPSFDLIEFALDIDLPDEIYNDEVFQRVYYAVIDMILLINDLHSYKKEQASGQDCLNALNIVMKTKGISLQNAANYIGERFESFMKDYRQYKPLVPPFGAKMDSDIQNYLQSLDDWLVGTLEWDFQCRRYFGDDKR